MKPSKGAVTSFLLALSAAVLLFGTLGWAADDKDQSDIEKRIQNAANVLDEIMAVKDKAIPDKIMGDAECIAVAALDQLARRGEIKPERVQKAIKELGIDPEKVDPVRA